jgi:ABC-2 type transport system permease protein
MIPELLIARHFWNNAFKNKAIFILIVFIGILLTYAACSGWASFVDQNEITSGFQNQARQDWLDNPDKHPHRMAHYGHFAFRPKAPLSIFDFGMESFFGNTIFLEAHKQNAVNFSQAGFSTSMLRFGEISIAQILQILLPLLIFFLGFGSVASERENGTLKIILTQGISWKQLLIGKSLGMIQVTMALYLPVMLTTILLWSLLQNGSIPLDQILRLLLVSLAYFIYLAIFCVIAVLVSAASKTSKSALVSLIGLWLALTIVLPRASQALGSYIYPAPSKITFQTGIENDILKEGDSHNPNDPHYKNIKDSLLAAHQVDSVQQLPFNYSGYIMAEGEKISARIYDQHFGKLLEVYQDQNSFSKMMAFFNPFMAIKNLSMTLSGTDYNAYIDFQRQAEAYRYAMAQKMNELQIKYISNKKPGPGDKPYIIDQKHWQEVPEFQYRPTGVSAILKTETITFLAFIFWITALISVIQLMSKKLTVN